MEKSPETQALVSHPFEAGAWMAIMAQAETGTETAREWLDLFTEGFSTTLANQEAAS